MKQSKKHHYVPKGLLRHFCYTKQKMYYFDFSKKKAGIVSRDIGKIFLKFHYYSVETPEGKRSDILEREFLQVLDSRIASFVAQFIKAREKNILPAIDFETQDFLRQFIYYHTKRNPDFMASLGFLDAPKAHISSAIKEYEQSFGPVAEAEKRRMLTDKKVAEIADSTRVRMTARESPLVMERLKGMNVNIAFAPSNKQFVIGSNPVVRFENRRGAELGDGSVELWTPLTPTVALGFSGPSRQNSIYLNLTDSDVRKLNCELVRQSSEVGSASDRLLRSLLGPGNPRLAKDTHE